MMVALPGKIWKAASAQISLRWPRPDATTCSLPASRAESFIRTMPALPGSSNQPSPACRCFPLLTAAELISGSPAVAAQSCGAPMRLPPSVFQLQDFRRHYEAARQSFNHKTQPMRLTTATSRALFRRPESPCDPSPLKLNHPTSLRTGGSISPCPQSFCHPLAKHPQTLLVCGCLSSTNVDLRLKSGSTNQEYIPRPSSQLSIIHIFDFSSIAELIAILISPF